MLNPDAVTPAIASAEVHLKRGDLANARKWLDTATGIEPEAYEVLVLSGNILARERRPEEALAALEKAVQRNPANPRARAQAAGIAAQIRRWDRAEEHLRRLLEIGYQPSRTHFALGQVAFLAPALLIVAALYWPRLMNQDWATPLAAAADKFDRRIITLLTFGPFAATLALSALSGRGTVALWGYPLWLFFGLWFVLGVRGAITAARIARVAAAWAAVFVLFVLAFVADYALLPGTDHRYRAVLYPGDRLADELARRFRAATGAPLAYVIGGMWDGGNVAHYAHEQPRVLIDGDPRRAPWIDLGDLSSKGAVVVWTGGDPRIIPVRLRRLAGDAQVQPPITLAFRRGGGALTVGWAILRPRPAFAQAVTLPPG